MKLNEYLNDGKEMISYNNLAIHQRAELSKEIRKTLKDCLQLQTNEVEKLLNSSYKKLVEIINWDQRFNITHYFNQ